MRSKQLTNEMFPAKMSVLKQKPKQLFVLGDDTLLEQPMIWVVGPRKMSGYCATVLAMITRSLEQFQCVTISWWAAWVDEAVHTVAFSSWVKTVVVLGVGIQRALQSSRRWFYEKILDSWWLLLSEYPDETNGAAWRFPQRNRLIWALSTLLLVPSCPYGSWTRYTVDACIACHVPVYCVPWPITQAWSALSNSRLESWVAQPVVDFNALFLLYWIQKNTCIPTCEDLTKDQQVLLCFCRSIQSLESIIQWLSWSLEKVLSELSALECNGKILQPSLWQFIAAQ